MNLPLPKYREVKDRYCVCYFGPCNEYITLLLGLRKQIEAALPGLHLYIGCHSTLCGPDKTLNEGDVRQMTRQPWSTQFGHIRELRCDLKNHPVEQFLKEARITPIPATHQPDASNRVVQLYPNGTSPTRSLTESEIQRLTTKYAKLGHVVRQNGPWQDAGLVVGVESPELWDAALNGKSVVLVNTGLGSDFFRVICPWGEVISGAAA